MHLRYNHSVDLIYMETTLLLQWFNPTVWLLKRELRDIHEYQADKGVLSQGIDATKYQLLLPVEACAPGPGRPRGLKCVRPPGGKSATGSKNGRQPSSTG